MKLTIKKNTGKIKNVPPQQSVNFIPTFFTTQPREEVEKSLPEECCKYVLPSSKSERHILLRPHNKEEKVIYNIIKNDCIYLYSKTCTKIKLQTLLQTIMKVIFDMDIRYAYWIGYLCAHCCCHFDNMGQRMNKIYRFVEKYRIVFEDLRCGLAIYDETVNRVQAYCQDHPETQVTPTKHTISYISKKYQQTLLLQYIPVQYSKYIIDQYISNEGDIEQYVRLCVSLSHFVLNTCHPVNEGHFVNLMFRPYMGVVQWPIVIANRYMFQSEPTNSPLYKEN